MRKLWILAIAALVVVVIAAPSFSAETTFTGSYRIRSVMDFNLQKQPTDFDNALYTGYFDQRFRLTITHKRSEYLKAVVIIDLAEDIWGNQRGFRFNNSTGTTDGFINTAYIEAITPVGLFQLGTNGTSRFGFGIWSDSGINGNGTNNPGVTYGIKVGNFIATASYIKYLDYCQNVLDNLAGLPAGFFQAWPHRGAIDAAGGPGSRYYNSDTDTYVVTAHYVTDKYKVGGLFQWILDPNAIAATLLVRGINGINLFPGSFRGELNFLNPAFGADPIGGLWPNPLGVGPNAGLGRMGLYGANLYIAGLYGEAKFFNDKLDVKGEITKIWGSAKLNATGEQFNAVLNAEVGGAFPTQRLPQELGVDGLNAYADISYDFDFMKLGLAFLYGSGEEHWTPFSQKHFNFNTTGNDDFHFGNIIVWGNQQLLASIANSPLGLGDNEENVTAVKMYWSTDPIEKLDIHGAFIWAKYTEPVGRYARNSAGALVHNWNAFYGHPMNYITPSPLSAGEEFVPAGVSDQLGWEVDLGATYQILDGLSLNSEFGVLFTGSAFDYRENGIAGGDRESWGPIFRWINTLTYEF